MIQMKKARQIFSRIRSSPEFGVLVAFLAVFLTFSLLAPDTFPTVRNLTGIFTIVSELGIIVIGVVFLMIAGEFNLAVSGIYAFSAFLFAVLANEFSSPVAFLITLVVASFWGLLCGIITLRWRIPSFIASLGMMMALRGGLLALTGGRSAFYEGDAIIPTVLARLMGYGIRPSHIWFIVLTLLFWFILTRTRYGNWVFATGGGKEVARAMGVNTNQVKLINFTISGLLAGLSGCIVLSRFEMVSPIFGVGLELEAIAAAVIGGTFLMGGYGTIIGAFLGTFLVGSLRVGLVMAGAPPYWYSVFVGAILIVAAVINLKVRRMEM